MRPVGVWLRARRRHVTRGAAVAGMLGVCMCAVAVFQGTQRQDELGQQHHNALLNRFAELAPATRKAQLGIVSATPAHACSVRSLRPTATAAPLSPALSQAQTHHSLFSVTAVVIAHQMLASVEKFTHHLNDRQQLDVPAASNLCEKKDFIINKFDSLLKKLIGDDKNLNITGARLFSHLCPRAVDAFCGLLALCCCAPGFVCVQCTLLLLDCRHVFMHQHNEAIPTQNASVTHTRAWPV